MNELIEIKNVVIGDDEVNSIDARDLHKFLELKEKFNEWIKRYLKEYDFVINSDFCRSTCTSTNGREIETYLLTLDMAKEMCMISKTEKGKEIRKYFIECEKKLREKNKKQINMSDINKTLKESLKVANSIGLKNKNASLFCINCVKKIHDFDCMKILNDLKIELPDNNKIINDKPTVYKIMNKTGFKYLSPTDLGKLVDKSAMHINIELERIGYQTSKKIKGQKYWTETEAGKDYCDVETFQLKNGAFGRKIWWNEKVLDVLYNIEYVDKHKSKNNYKNDYEYSYENILDIDY